MQIEKTILPWARQRMARPFSPALVIAERKAKWKLKTGRFRDHLIKNRSLIGLRIKVTSRIKLSAPMRCEGIKLFSIV
jgi:hypothetical protein